MISKSRSLILSSIGLLTIFVAGLDVIAAKENAIGTVSFLIGGPNDVQIKHKELQDWSPAKLNTSVLSGDAMQTKQESRCEVKLLDGSVIRIGENTLFEFTEASISKSTKNVKSELKKGQVWSNLTKVKSKEGFQIKAPTAVCAVRGTIYRVDADSTTKCLVYDGSVYVGPVGFWGQPLQRGNKSLQPIQVPGPQQVPGPYEVSLDQWISIVKGYQIEVRADGKFASSRFDEKRDAELDWVRWNLERDAQIRR
jgi:hypothetical protein